MPDRYGDELDWPVVPAPRDLDVPDREWAAQQRALAIVNCDLCDDDGYRGTRVCDHVDRSVVARRGLEKCRRVLNRKKTEEAEQ